MPTLISKLVGMSFYKHALAITKLIRENYDGRPEAKPLPLLLVREPNNPHDPNAVAVYIKLGHIERDKAAIISGLYDVPDEHMVENAAIIIYAKADVDTTGQVNVLTELPEVS